jgi:ADP-heptose:LPS heptosyltransferase/2-polyprenyl-3-methyl-5-hydroxy-6-metoxy-1,4-benzoquinol methylase
VDFLRKIVLWDYIQLLKKERTLGKSQKVRAYFIEYVHKIVKIIVRNNAFYRGKQFHVMMTELRNKGGLEEVPCNLCGSRESRDVGEKLRFRVVECLGCGLRFTNPRLNRKARYMLYSRNYLFGYRAWLGQQIKCESAVQEGLLAEQQVKNILIYKRGGRFLDVGCSTGEVLTAAGKKGFDCWGIEPNKWACTFAESKRGLRVINGELKEISFQSDFFDVVSCMEVIEHVPDPLGDLKEIRRVLKDDGILMLSTPNFGCDEAKQLQMNWKHNKPWEHIYLFDYAHLYEMLKRAGFEIIDVKTELSDGVGYSGCLLVIVRKKDFRNQTAKEIPRILVMREGARGDVLLATPVIRALRERYPKSSITFKTDFPEILTNNPHVDRIVRSDDNGEYDLVFNLKYELFPKTSFIEAYARIARVEVKNPHLEFYLTEGEKAQARTLFKSLNLKRTKLAVLHTMVSGRMKSWDRENYRHICHYLRAKHYDVITVGDLADCTEVSEAINLIGKTSIRLTAAIISEADLFFGLDSFPMHLANAFDVPSVVLFGSTDPIRVLCRDETVRIVRSREMCLGCRHETTPDRWLLNVSCRRGRPYCMESISPEHAIKVIDHFIS